MNVPRSPVLSRRLLALLFCTAGTLHFVFPVVYARIIPPQFPAPLILVWISGMCEVLGGIGVLCSPVRRSAGFGLIALLIAVFPANIYMFLQQQVHGWSLYTLLLLLRLPLQFLLMIWVQRSTLATPHVAAG